MRKIFIIITIVGLLVTTGLCLKFNDSVNADIMESCHTTHSKNSNYSDYSQNHSEINSNFMDAGYEYKKGICPSADVRLNVIAGINHSYRNQLVCVMYDKNGDPYNSYNETTYSTDTPPENLLGHVSDNIFRSFGHIDTTYEVIYNGPLLEDILNSTWYVYCR